MAAAETKNGSKNTSSKSDAKSVPNPSDQNEALCAEMERLIDGGERDLALDTILGIVDTLRADNDRLGLRVHHLTRIVHGRQSEKLTPEELRQLRARLRGDSRGGERGGRRGPREASRRIAL